MKKNVIFVVYSCNVSEKVLISEIEKKVKNAIWKHDRDICLEFYNAKKEFDPFKEKFNRILKKRKPSNTLFYDCNEETIVATIKTIEERVAEEVKFFFKNFHIEWVKIPKAQKVESVKDMTLLLAKK